MAPRLDPALEREIGVPGPIGTVAGLSGWFENWEETAELQFPNSIIVYDRMRKTDAQIRGLLRGISLPVRAARWHLETDGVDARVVKFVEDELGLTPTNQARRRRLGEGLNWREFLSHALLMLPYGFMPFEQVYRIGPPNPGLEGIGPPQLAHLRKLAPRMPRTVTGFKVARDGGLEGITQHVPREQGDAYAALGYEEVTIPTDRLVMFVNEREGADWAGTSILRSDYKHWLIKDGLIRLGPMAVERNGMGLAVVNYPANGDKATALAAARAARGGEDAGIALPDGYTFSLVGVTGSVRDELPLLNYHDQQMGHGALAMFMDLGHDRGARSLGETFLDFFLMAENALIADVGEIVTEYVVRDLVRLNFGEDEPYPPIGADPVEPGEPATAASLKTLVEAGLLTPDNEIEVEIRRARRLPPMSGQQDGPPDEIVDEIEDVEVDEVEPMPEPPGGPTPSQAVEDEPDRIPVRPHNRRRPGTARAALSPRQQAEYDAETETIRANAEKPVNRRPHPFKPADWTHPNGHPRCIRCGAEEPISGTCNGTGKLSARPADRGVTLEDLEARLEQAKARRAAILSRADHDPDA